MSSFSSDKCTKDELAAFKAEVTEWLNAEFPEWHKRYKAKAFTCYNGDVRLYDGRTFEYINKRSSFRRREAELDSNGKVKGYIGTRGKHTTVITEYISINRDEFAELKEAWARKSGDDYDFQNDLIFSKLQTEVKKCTS